MASKPAMPKERVELLDRAWTLAAELYAAELVPRFDPWLKSGLQELQKHALPPGPLLVPCCGPGHELPLLHKLYGGVRRVVGLDLSRGMVDLALREIDAYEREQRLQGAGAAAGLEAVVADASCLDAFASAAAVFSVFGLQQLGALAPQALASWVRCLAPGGVAVVVLWPSVVEQSGPWQAYDQVLLEKAAGDAGRPMPAPDASAQAPPQEWEVRLTEAALSEVEGAELLVDRLQAHPIHWPSAERFWEVMTEGGPWRARRLVAGDAAMAELGGRVVAKLGGGRPLEHAPSARILVLRRRPEPGASPASAL
ncbi:hypothetical protein HYH03_014836 [Edaphochlamys debaryana]|uniref:Methyltransferase domain-containing protein n=1 Tax=Edaphochlamys debaryana TaxID=47281 RepID=A0A836BRU2_9CHLO|nr:hypothetical protein HYH03_014836 [Edaphochlamys debaryana]|eukprot:KAG2486535.1 hypothetical protein HYH03_014836 [Edaphochlamys debaryana]